MKTLIIAFAAIMFGVTASAQQNKHSTIVLIHGAWSDASAWDAVTPILKAKGYKVLTINLPGHGTDTTPFTAITLQSYVDAVKHQIGDLKNVTLVGHSMSGIIISQVAEDMPGSIKKLVYLTAYLPANGQSLLDLAKTDAGSHIGKFLQIDQANASAGVSKEGVVDVFVADASEIVKNKFAKGVQPDPLAPFATPVKLSEERSGQVEKVYIYATDDHAISYPTQQAMAKNAQVKKQHILKSSHTPFYSMPGKVASILIEEAK